MNIITTTEFCSVSSETLKSQKNLIKLGSAACYPVTVILEIAKKNFRFCWVCKKLTNYNFKNTQALMRHTGLLV